MKNTEQEGVEQMTSLSTVVDALKKLMEIMQRNEEICADISIVIGVGLPLVQNKKNTTEPSNLVDDLYYKVLKAVEKQDLLTEMLANIKQRVS